MKRLLLLCQPLLLCQLLVVGGRASTCPRLCTCSGGLVECSRRSLSSSSLPASFPPDTQQLRLHDNRLTTLPNGLLDNLTELHTVTLHGNPWSCDCGILYLRAWLLSHPPHHTPHQGVNCSSPPGLRGRLVVYLSEEELLGSCHYWYCDLAVASQVSLLVFVLLQGALLAVVVVFLRRFERMSKEARRTREDLTGGEFVTENEYSPLKDM